VDQNAAIISDLGALLPEVFRDSPGIISAQGDESNEPPTNIANYPKHCFAPTYQSRPIESRQYALSAVLYIKSLIKDMLPPLDFFICLSSFKLEQNYSENESLGGPALFG
jgi:hypothetical protein